jgi:chromosome segregation ATPase
MVLYMMRRVTAMTMRCSGRQTSVSTLRRGPRPTHREAAITWSLMVQSDQACAHVWTMGRGRTHNATRSSDIGLIRSRIIATVRSIAMQTKDEYLAKLKAQLDEWEDDLAQLREKASDASDDVKAKLDEQIAHLKAKWEEGSSRREEIIDAADDKWEAIKDEAEEKWEELKVSVKDSIERVKSMFS